MSLQEIWAGLLIIALIAPPGGFIAFYLIRRERRASAERARLAVERPRVAAVDPPSHELALGCIWPLFMVALSGGAIAGAIYLLVRFIRWAWDTPLFR